MLVPIDRRSTYADTRRFAEIVAGAIARAHPGLATTEWSKAKRRGVLIDANQNGEGKTIASVYSVRPKPGAPGLDAAALGGGGRVARPGVVHDGRRARARRPARRPVRGRADDEAVARAGARRRSVRLDELVDELDRYFRIAEVENDDWSPAFEDVYAEPYWRDYVEPGYEGKWNGLMVRGAGEVERVVTCVFPSDRIVGALEPGTLLFSEHPLDFADEPGFLPLSRESFATLKDAGLRLLPRARAAGHAPRGVAVAALRRGRRAGGARGVLPDRRRDPGRRGDRRRQRALAGRAGRGVSRRTSGRRSRCTCSHGRATRPAASPSSRAAGPTSTSSQASIERGCRTYVTGNAATNCRLDWIQEKVRAFRELADAGRGGADRRDALRHGEAAAAGDGRAGFGGWGCRPSSCPTGRSSRSRGRLGAYTPWACRNSYTRPRSSKPSLR